MTRATRDAGQTLPLFVWVAGILLFVSFAFFAFAQAASVRNGAQTAADAAALAAAQAGREEMVQGLLAAEPGMEGWGRWLDADNLVGRGAADAAGELAARNHSRVTSFARTTVDGSPAFKVTVETNYATGTSVIPGAASRKAKASATAVLRSQCALDGEDGGDITLDCGVGSVRRFPASDLSGLEFPAPSKIFDVYLAS
ncbi:pilus assembly protein TadG-related protein [Streptomyces sp. P6-2-1]|uniref:pilus assembly protein TadG-related protein n=1 Tax=Streptomyces sp. P6-2-1 TaxID=3422591 RepID=UPI003D36B727